MTIQQNMCELFDVVHRLGDVRVLVVGDLILDRYLYGDAERISPEAPVPVLRAVNSREAVGGSANAAACLRALGCTVHCGGMVGADAHGTALLSALDALGIDHSGVCRCNDRPTTTKTRFIGLAQHRHRQQLMRVDEEDARPVDGPEADEIIVHAQRRMEACDVVCLEDYDKGIVTDRTAHEIIAHAAKLGRRLLVDPARLRDFARYTGSDIITPNREELSVASGRLLRSPEEAAAAAHMIMERLDLRAAIVTLDRDGVVVATREGTGADAPWRHLPTTPRSVYDNTGAGDAVLAMLAAAVGAGTDLETAGRLANIAGGLEVERFGCVPITTDEVLAELRLADRAANGKLRSIEDLLGELDLRRDRGETIAFTNGCFDILHAGHVDYLRRCRREASLLIVGVNSDASVRRLNKSDNRPINPLADRVAVVGGLESVDYVVVFDDPSPEVVIRRIAPDVLIKGEDWADRGVVGREFVESHGGRVVLLPLVEGKSTTAVIERIKSGAASRV